MFISIIFLPLFWSLSASSRLCTHETMKHYAVNSSSALSDLLKPSLNCSIINIQTESMTLSTTLILEKSFNLSFIGKDSALTEILCEEDSGLGIDDSELIHLENLLFTGCSVTSTDIVSSNYQHAGQAAVYVYNSSDIQITNCYFFNNTATGLILYDVTGSVSINSTNFSNPHPESSTSWSNKTYGGLIIHRESRKGEAVYVFETCYFDGNTNYQDHFAGGMTVLFGAKNSNSLIEIRNSVFIRNAGRSGGGIYLNLDGASLSLTTVNVKATRFLDNKSSGNGGGILVRNVPNSGNISVNLDHCEFDFNTALANGGGIASFNVDQSRYEMGSTDFVARATNWTRNSAPTGSAVSLNGKYQLMEFVFEDCWIYNNSRAKFTKPNAVGAVFVTGSKITIRGDSEISRNYGSALYLREQAQAEFEAGTARFNGNEATQGGAIALHFSSTLHLGSNSTLFFTFNSAVEKGGAIYAEVDEYEPCVFDFLKYNSAIVRPEGSFVIFAENYAYNYEKEQNIYVNGHYPRSCIDDNNSTFLRSHPFRYDSELNSSVLFDPSTVKFSIKPIMLGEGFRLNPTVLDRFDHNTTGSAFITLAYDGMEDVANHDNAAFELVGPSTIGLDKESSKNDAFRIQGKHNVLPQNLRLQVFFKKKTGGYRDGIYKAPINLSHCKLGFKFSPTNDSFGTCSCVVDGNQGNMFCLNSNTACVRNGYWFGKTPDGGYNTFICDTKCNYANQKCPTKMCSNAPDYCELTNDTNAFCTQGRGGLLCSKCQKGYDFTAYSYQCVPSETCSPRNSVLLILGMLLYWLFMVCFFFIFISLDLSHLSIGTGVASGIVYYFSVVFVLTRGVITDQILDVFLNIAVAITQICAYLFGMIPVCLFQGLDNLPHQLLRFASPLIVVVSIVAIIWFSRYCKCPKMFSLAENSPNHAICLLILISYTSMTYNCLEILRPIEVNGRLHVYVDPEIPYFHKQHLPYALVAIVVELFISLPICILFLFAPCISKLSSVNLVKLRLKPILDEYQACYKEQHRWYAGFYFLARQLMYLANCFGGASVLPQSNCLVHFVSILVLIVMTTVQPYKKQFWYLNVIDAFLLTDVLLLSVLPINSHVNSASVPGYMGTIQKVTPWVLILLPCLYLFGMITMLLVRHLRRLCGGFRKGKSQNQSTTPISINSNEPEYKRTLAKSPYVDPFSRDYGEKEPLLRDSDEDSVTSHTGAEPQNPRRGDSTYASLQASKLRQFPAASSKAITY